MRFILFVFLIYGGISYAQKIKLSVTEIRTRVNFMQKNCFFSDSLDFVDSTCSYSKGGIPYSGYVIHYFDDQYRFNLFEGGKYYGEEWIFDSIANIFDSDSLIQKLKEFRIRSDTNEHFMIVTTYYDFQTNSVHEIYVHNRYECAARESEKFGRFDPIFGGNDYRILPYRSFYKNGNKKEVSEGHPYLDGKIIRFYENGKKESYSKVRKKGNDGLIKEFDEQGYCTKRIKVRNNKIRGFYIIMEGEFSLSFIARRQQKNKKVKELRTR